MSEQLQLGAKGPEVARLQTLLNKVVTVAGEEPLGVDGDFGPLTQARVMIMQKAGGIRVDGIVGPFSWALLEGRPIMPIDIEKPENNGLLINGLVVPVPGVKVIGSHDAAWAHLAPGDSTPRANRPQMWIWHKTIADDPEKILPGKGPVGGARRTADYWAGDPHYSGTHLVTGHEGELACLADLYRVCAFHATVSNWLSVGQETCELFGGGCHEAAYETTVRSTFVGCEALGIQIQVPKLNSYPGHPWPRMLDGGKNMVGIFGHRNNTEQRGKWDPGEHLWEMAIARGAEAFDFGGGEDIAVWKDRQRELVRRGHRLEIDGVPALATTEALKLEGYRGGIWINGRDNFHG